MLPGQLLLEFLQCHPRQVKEIPQLPILAFLRLAEGYTLMELHLIFLRPLIGACFLPQKWEEAQVQIHPYLVCLQRVATQIILEVTG